MNARSMRQRLLVCGLAVCVALSGCAATSAARRIAGQVGAGSRAPVKSEPALAQVRPGATTRDELLAALGPTASVRLDSGYEVWAYRLEADRPGQPPKGEFVVLLAPSGKVTKTRLRLTPVATTPEAKAQEQGDEP